MNSIVLDLFINCKKSCEALGIDDDFYKTICTRIPQIKPLQIGKDGTVLEWNEPLEESEVHHRHVSHLYALHPAGLITPKDTALFDACKKTLERRGDDGTGWSLAWKVNFWARLRDGDRALRLVDKLLTFVDPDGNNGRGGVYANLFDAHPPFQIDGNFGVLSGICEMLLQSDDDNLYHMAGLPQIGRVLKIPEPCAGVILRIVIELAVVVLTPFHLERVVDLGEGCGVVNLHALGLGDLFQREGCNFAIFRIQSKGLCLGAGTAVQYDTETQSLLATFIDRFNVTLQHCENIIIAGGVKILITCKFCIDVNLSWCH